MSDSMPAEPVTDSNYEGARRQDSSRSAPSQNDRLLARHEITMERLNHGQVAAAAVAYEEAFKTNASHKYTDNTPDARPPSRLAKMLCNLVIRLNYHYDIHRNRHLLTVKESMGYAFVEAYAPGGYHPNPSSPLEKLLKYFEKTVYSYIRTPEQKKRQAEKARKTMQLTFETLGPNVLDEWWLLIMLCTHPDAQRRGYGGALVDAVNNLVDSAGKPCLLMSTDEANNAFYEAHGFVVIGQTLLGDSNATWKEAPVVCSLMTRDLTRLGETK